MNINYKIGDSRIHLPNLPDGAFDSCVTDSPYDIGFMGKDWDRSGIAFDIELWSEVFRVLKPGAYLLNFGGTRTYDLMVGAVRQAGFEIRDTIVWIYGQGFSKIGTWNEKKAKEGSTKQVRDTSRMMVDAGWDGWGGALKPAIDLIVQARKPISEKNVAMNVLAHGVGGINVDGCRIEHDGDLPEFIKSKEASVTCYGDGLSGSKRTGNIVPQGRFPANVALGCTCEKVIPGKVGEMKPISRMTTDAHTWKERKGIYTPGRKHISYGVRGDTAPIHTDPNCPCYMLDAQSGELTSGRLKPVPTPKQNAIYGKFNIANPYGDYEANKGGASRFFYVAKASKSERWFYCNVCEKAYPGDKREAHKKHSMKCLDCGVDYEPIFDSDSGGKTSLMKSKIFDGNYRMSYPKRLKSVHATHRNKSNLLFHVTQKPEQLIRYLIRLVTPPGGTVLDPFVGSGTTLVAARMEGMNALGIEIGTEYEPLISARVNAIPRSIFSFQETE